MMQRTHLGPYEIHDLIGSGGMAEVYLARDSRLNRVVALKVLVRDERDDPERRRRFLQEAKAASVLNHPNIITIHDVGTDSGIDYIAMEYVAGKTLAQSIPPAGLEPAVAARIARQIAGALAKAHAMGIVHRDLKPSNVMITEDGGVKVLDFGLAKIETGPLTDPATTSTVTQEGMIVGTVAYMSPEQAEGLPVDARSDIFTFGVVLYEMLTGRRAFAGTTLLSTMVAILHREPPPLENASEFQRILERCLKKDPAERFQSLAEVTEALDAVVVGSPAVRTEPTPSVAVMPFVNLSADQENEYFSDGLTEEIITALTHVPGLKVAGRTSSFWFRGKDVRVAEIGRALQVQHVLEGSVRRARSRVRVTAQLIKVADGFQLWSERYDREMTDIFAVQDEIAQAIAKALQLKFSPLPLAHVRHKPALPAYEAFLKGRYHLGKNTPEGLERARENLEQAIGLDPKYAEAYAQMAYYYNLLVWFDLRRPREVMPLAKIVLLQALELDASLPEAHAGLGVIAAAYDYDWREAERRFSLAMAADPIPSYVRYCYAPFYLLPSGRFAEAVSQLELALIDDPLHVAMRSALGTFLIRAGQFDRAIVELRETLAIEPTFWTAYWMLGECYACMGQWADALSALQEAFRLAPYFSEVVGLLAGVLTRIGQRQRAQELVEKLTSSGSRSSKVVGLSVYHLMCDEPDAAADWLELRIEERYTQSLFLDLWSPIAASLRASSRWPGLARKMKLQDLPGSPDSGLTCDGTT